MIKEREQGYYILFSTIIKEIKPDMPPQKKEMFFLSPGLEKQLEVFLISGVLLEGNTISGDVVQKTSLLIQGSSFFVCFISCASMLTFFSLLAKPWKDRCTVLQGP